MLYPLSYGSHINLSSLLRNHRLHQHDLSATFSKSDRLNICCSLFKHDRDQEDEFKPNYCNQSVIQIKYFCT